MWETYLKLMPNAKMLTTDVYGSQCLFDGPAVFNPRSNRWQPGRDGVNQVTLGLASTRPDLKEFKAEMHYSIRPDMDLSFTNDIVETMRKYNELMNVPQSVTTDGMATIAPTPIMQLNKVPGEPDVVEHVKNAPDRPFSPPPTAAKGQVPVAPLTPQPHAMHVLQPEKTPQQQAEALRLQAKHLLEQAAKLSA